MNPIGFLKNLMPRVASAVPDYVSLSQAFPDASSTVSLTYLAISLGLIGWDAVDETISDEENVAADVNILNAATEVRKLLNQIRAGRHLSSDTIDSIKDLTIEEQIDQLDSAIQTSPLASESRPQLIYFQGLLRVANALSQDVLSARAEIEATQSRLQDALSKNISVQEKIVIRIAENCDKIEKAATSTERNQSTVVATIATYLERIEERTASTDEQYSTIVTLLASLRSRLHRSESSYLDLAVERLSPSLQPLLLDLWAYASGGLTNEPKTSYRLKQIIDRTFFELAEQIIENCYPLLSNSEQTAVVDVVGRVQTLFDESRAKLATIALAVSARDAARLLTDDYRGDMAADFAREAIYDGLEVISTLPQMNASSLADIRDDYGLLLRTAALKLQESKRRVQRSAKNSESSSEAAIEASHRRAMINEFNKVKLLGVEADDKSSLNYRLSVAYVTLSVSNEHQVSSVPNLLAESRRILLRGLAGSGKTTLLQWLALNCAAGSIEDEEIDDWNDLCPFLIRLRTFARMPLPRVSELASISQHFTGAMLSPRWVHRKLTSGEALILIDGADEVPENRRQEVQEWIVGLVELFPQCTFVVSSRPTAVDSEWLVEANFLAAELLPMDSARIEQFVDQWHSAVAAFSADMRRQQELQSLAKTLKGRLLASKALRSIASNPLLCAMLCALNRDRSGNLPSERIAIYSKCCEVLVHERDLARRIELSEYPSLSLRQKLVILEDLAYWMMDNGYTSVPRVEAMRRVDRKLGDMINAPEGSTGESVLRLLTERTLLLREPSVGEIDFAHRTFQEFLAARYAADQRNLGKMLTKSEDDIWRETVVLFSGILTTADRNAFLEALLRVADEKENPRQHLLALESFQASIEVSAEIRSRNF